MEYHLALGYDTIFINDNNHLDGERFEEVIADYIDSGEVVVSDYRGMTQMQCRSYVEIYNKYSDDYDWMTFIDVDEFITLTQHSNIKEYLAQDGFANYDQILLSWMVIGDSGQIRKTEGPLVERLTEPLDNPKRKINRHVKSTLRAGIKDLKWRTSHYFVFENYLERSCDSCSRQDRFDALDYTFMSEALYDGAYIRHYVTKSLEEYITVKLQRRSSAFGGEKAGLYRSNLNYFWGINEKTKEKVAFAKSIMGFKEYWVCEYYGFRSRFKDKRRGFLKPFTDWKYRVIYPIIIKSGVLPKRRQERFVYTYLKAMAEYENR